LEKGGGNKDLLRKHSKQVKERNPEDQHASVVEPSKRKRGGETRPAGRNGNGGKITSIIFQGPVIRGETLAKAKVFH